MRKFRVAGLMAAAAALAGAAAPANALVVALLSTTAESGGTRFNYDVTLASDEAFTASSLFTIFDFAGYVSGSATSPSGFTFSYEPSPGLPALFGSGVTDDPTIGNLVFRSTGAQTGSSFAFSAVSTLSGVNSDGFSGITTKTDGIQAGTAVGSQGTVGVPVLAAVPEPAAWAMMGIGFGLVGFATRARRRGRIARVYG